MDPTNACPTCGASPMARYCAECGEKRISQHDLSIRHYVTELLEIVTHLDSRILRATWELVRHPGGLSAYHFSGRRIRYVTPLRLFVVLSVVYFLSASIYPNPAFTTPLAIQLHGNDFYPGFAARQVALAMQHKGWDYATLESSYDAKTAVLSKTMVFTLIPVFALLFEVLLIRKRRYFSEHVVVATHFWSFALLLIGVFVPLLLALLVLVASILGVTPGILTADAIPTVILQCSFAIYLFIMLRRVYAVSYWYGALVAGAIAWSFFFLVWLFRFLLFVVTLSLL
jgi:Protein of unknown function (DUF3667)